MTQATNESSARAMLHRIKNEAGSHSPSIATLARELPAVKIEIDACFLSNPYATDLFLNYFTEEVVGTEQLRRLIEYYPSQNAILARVVAKRLGVTPETIFLGNGASEIIQAILHNFCGRKLLINLPTFSPYYEFVGPETQVIYNHLRKEEQFRLDVDRYLALIKQEQPDTIILINPNNPDGGYVTRAEVRAFLQTLRATNSRVNHVIIDESFVHFAFEDDQMALLSFADLTQEFPNVILVKSLSKDFGIAGVRVGYAIMEASKVRQLLNHGFLWNISGLAEYFLQLWARDEFMHQYNQVRTRYIGETQAFIMALSQIPGLHVYPSMANFALLELVNGRSAFDFFSHLLINHGVYTRSCSDKKGLSGEFVRIAARTPAENARILDGIQDLFRETVTSR